MNLEKFKHILQKIEDNDKKLNDHMERVAMISYSFGKELGLSGEELEKLYISGLLHEIGRFYLSEKNIINNEYLNVDKTFHLFSSAMIESFKEFSQVAKIVRQLFENIDGSGYPNKTIGEDIELYSIILRISDFYDTCRLEGNTHDETTAKIREKTNTVFPKKMITPFIKMLINDNDLELEYER